MAEEKEGKGSIKVQDKRRFDSDGTERHDPKPGAKQTDPEPGATSKDFEIKPSPDEGADQGIDFSSFVTSMGTQALMFLGHIKVPEGVDIQVDKVAAKQTIDILSMIQERTKGNLDATEAKLIEQILYSLRVAFVKAV